MADFISEIAAKAGIDKGLAQNGVGALLSSLQDKLPADAFSKLSSVVPNATGLLSSFQGLPGPAQQGAPSTLGGLAGNLLGGQSEGIAGLVSQFSKAGFTLETAKAFIPVAMNLLREKLPADTLKQVESAIPGLSGLLSQTDSGSLVGKIKKLF